MDLEVGRGESVTIGGALVQTEFALEDARIRSVEGEAAERYLVRLALNFPQGDAGYGLILAVQ